MTKFQCQCGVARYLALSDFVIGNFFKACLKNVVADILPAMEGGVLPPRTMPYIFNALSAGLEARLYGRQDACRHHAGHAFGFSDTLLTESIPLKRRHRMGIDWW
jgi:hypothetical protein